MKYLFGVTVLTLALERLTNASPISGGRSVFTRSRLHGRVLGTPRNATYDYVIVGGGTAGLAMAARLSENPSTSVAVIEAGSFYEQYGNYSQVPAYDTLWTGKDPEDTNPQLDWGFVTTPQEGALNARIHYARGKCFGGSSARNYMGYLGSTKDAYAKWADMVEDQSYTFDQFLPYFQKSLDFTSPDKTKRAANATPEYDRSSFGKGGGPLSVTFSNYAYAVSSFVQKGMKELGIKPINGLTSGKLLGSSYVLQTIQASNQERESSATAFLRPALNRTNLAVYDLTLGKKIIFSSDKTATGIMVSTNDKEYLLSARNEIILSAGAFQSPQLLMVSGVGPAATLSKNNVPVVADRPGVGQNMQDHILMGPSYRVNAITGSSIGNPAFAAEARDLYNNEQSGLLTNSGGDFGGWEHLPPSLQATLTNDDRSSLSNYPADWPDIEYLNIAGYLGYQNNFIRDSPIDGYNYASVAVALMKPLSRGTIDISSTDMADPPLINPNWLTHPTDQAVAVAGYKRVRELFATSAMKQVVIGNEYFPGTNVTTDADILALIRQSVSTVYHASATCAMGPRTDPNAVVDAEAKVIGVQGLRVVDASAFPFLPPGHPMATIYALAEKIAGGIVGARDSTYR